MLFLILVFTWLSASYGQKVTGPVLVRPVYFDLSPPLRFLKAVPEVNKRPRKAERAEEAIETFFIKAAKKSSSKQPFRDAVKQVSFGTVKADTQLVNFEGTGNVNAGFPPDTYGDVGKDYYFHLVNYSFSIFDKAGALLYGPMNSEAIWSGMPDIHNSGDGIVLFDEQADRWFMSALCMPNFPSPPYYEMIAVSQTSDPTGSWYRWKYPFDEIPDYPKFGVWQDAYFMSCNRFSQQGYFKGIGAVAFDRNAMLAGDAAPLMELFKLEQSTVSYILPADCDGPFPASGTPGYFMYMGNNLLCIYEFQTNWVDPAAAAFGNLSKLPVSHFNTSILGIPQKGSAKRLDPHSERLMCRLQFRKFEDHLSMVVNHTVKTGTRAGIRWYELRKSNSPWSVYQQSTYAPDSTCRWMGSMAMDASGNIALGYSVSSEDLYPSVRYTGRMKNDPPGLMTLAERSVVEGGGAQTHTSGYYAGWGDYSSMTVDPSMPATFWYTQQYYPVTADYDWHTRVAAISFAGILDVNTVAQTPDICMGQSDQLDAEVTGGDGTYLFSWSSFPEGFTSSLRNPIVTPDVPTSYIVTVTSGSQQKTDTVRVGILPPASGSAGEDTIVCRYVQQLSLSGSALNYSSVKWVTGGDGTFSDAGSLYTTYLLGPSDRNQPVIDLELIVYPQPPCPVVSDHKLIRIDTCAGIPAILPGSPLLMIIPNPGKDKFSITIPKEAIRIEISDLNGRIILFDDLTAMHRKEYLPDLSGQPAGIYPVRVILKDRILFGKILME